MHGRNWRNFNRRVNSPLAVNVPPLEKEKPPPCWSSLSRILHVFSFLLLFLLEEKNQRFRLPFLDCFIFIFINNNNNLFENKILSLYLSISPISRLFQISNNARIGRSQNLQRDRVTFTNITFTRSIAFHFSSSSSRFLSHSKICPATRSISFHGEIVTFTLGNFEQTLVHRNLL